MSDDGKMSDGKRSHDTEDRMNHSDVEQQVNAYGVPVDPGLATVTMGSGRSIPPIPCEDEKEYVVDFDGPEDPTHPFNWSLWKKLSGCFSLGFTTMTVAWGSAIYATAVPELEMIYGVSEVVLTLGLSLYIAGFAGGPVIWGSLSEMYGRKAPIMVSQLLFVCFIFGVAVAKDLQTIMLCRFFAGFLGAAPLSVVGGSFSDMFNHKHRGTALIGFLSTVFLGPIIAPVVGGYIASSYLGWRWTHYITGIMGSLALVLDFFLYEESHYPVILGKKAQKLRRDTGNWAIHGPLDNKSLEVKEIILTTLFGPIKLMFTQPIILLSSIYIAFVYGILYLCLEVYPIIFIEGYGFSPANGELPYIGVFVGMMIGAGYLVCMEPHYFRKVVAKGFKPAPEARLDAAILPSILFPIGLFWLCWTGNYPDKVHWIVPTIGGGFIGFALMGIFLGVLTYAVESYLHLAASVLAANAFLRAAFAAAFPLFAKQMFHNMGVQWAGTLLGCIAIVMVPIPVLFRVYATRLEQSIKK